MSESQISIEPHNAVPDAMTVRTLDLFLKTGTVPIEYIQRFLGRTASTTDDPLSSLRPRRTPAGRPILEEHELWEMECPFPPDPDL